VRGTGSIRWQNSRFCWRACSDRNESCTQSFEDSPVSNDDLITSAFRRATRLGGLVTRVGMSLVTEQTLGFLRSDPIQQARMLESQLKNAARVVEALGEMKGAAMKVGQMLSLHEGMMPPEIAVVLSALQKAAPNVSYRTMRRQIDAELPDADTIFSSLEREPLAAASIGQVYRGVLHDGRPVAVKVQYPEIGEVVRADLKNLKVLFGSLIAMFVKIDFDPLWEELSERLMEELDYRQEAAHMRAMAELHADIPEVIVPLVIDEASTGRVLTMELVDAIEPASACSQRYPQSLKDRWGVLLFQFVVRGLLEHRFLHADPNFANFGFRDDGRLVVYDYGCMKRVEPGLSRAYASLARAVEQGNYEALPSLLKEMGVHHKTSGAAMELDLIKPIFDLAGDIFQDSPPYRFRHDPELYDSLIDLGRTRWQDTTDIVFPRDMIFIDRTLGGLFANLGSLEAAAPWRDLLVEFLEPVEKG